MSLMEDKDIKRKIGTIEDKIASSSSNPKAPKGNFVIDGEKYTCWKEETWNMFNKGDNVDLEYRESEWNGVTNRNIINILIAEAQSTLPETKPTIKVTEKEIEEAPIEEEVKEQAIDIVHQEVGPDPDNYYMVMKGKKYKLIPTGEYLADGIWKKVNGR